MGDKSAFIKLSSYCSPCRYPYFDVVMGLTWSYDPQSYAGGSVVAGRSPMSDRSKMMTHTKRDILALQVGGWAWGLWTHPVKSFNC
jgi:hypothetical protein